MYRGSVNREFFAMITLRIPGRWLLVSSFISLIFFPSAYGFQPVNVGQVTLGWNASTDPTVVGYHLYYGNTSGVYTSEITVGTNTVDTVTGLAAGLNYYFTVTCYNTAGIESGYASEVSYNVSQTTPVVEGSLSEIGRAHV